LELPALSLSEPFVKPTTMLYRNLLAMEAEELQQRRAAWQPKPPPRGYGRMYAAHIQQAHEGCHFDFLLGTDPLPEPEIH
jgi:dihydroxy-acid dehydratase